MSRNAQLMHARTMAEGLGQDHSDTETLKNDSFGRMTCDVMINNRASAPRKTIKVNLNSVMKKQSTT